MSAQSIHRYEGNRTCKQAKRGDLLVRGCVLALFRWSIPQQGSTLSSRARPKIGNSIERVQGESRCFSYAWPHVAYPMMTAKGMTAKVMTAKGRRKRSAGFFPASDRPESSPRLIARVLVHGNLVLSDRLQLTHPVQQRYRVGLSTKYDWVTCLSHRAAPRRKLLLGR